MNDCSPFVTFQRIDGALLDVLCLHVCAVISHADRGTCMLQMTNGQAHEVTLPRGAVMERLTDAMNA